MVFKTGDVREGVAVTNNSFVLPAYDVTVVAIFKMTKEAEVAIGSGTSADSYLPTYAYYKYSLTQQIYTAAEVGQAGTITKIAFKVSNSKSTTRTLDVYLKHTSKTAFTSITRTQGDGSVLSKTVRKHKHLSIANAEFTSCKCENGNGGALSLELADHCEFEMSGVSFSKWGRITVERSRR